jgi:hypothetical protein
MLTKTVVGFGLLFALLALGAAVQRLRRSGRPGVRALADRVHWGVGVVAVGCAAVLLLAAVQLVRG